MDKKLIEQSNSVDLKQKGSILMILVLIIVFIAIAFAVLLVFNKLPLNITSLWNSVTLTKKYGSIIRPSNASHSVATQSATNTPPLLLQGTVTDVKYPNPQAATFTVKEDGTGKNFYISTSPQTKIQLETVAGIGKNQPKIANASAITKFEKVKITKANYGETDTFVADFILISYIHTNNQ